MREKAMSEPLQEYVHSGSQQLRVDRDAGIIRGVKLLGLASRNGRRYRENALVDAVSLYEGAKVNINHPKGHPLSPRDYQDRLGVVRGVAFRAGEGLFGDLHFNPKHALSEQLVWDAEHAPQNVGMSHNVLARTTRSGDDTVVEAITKVQSIDLVADPATTSGLYEQAGGRELRVEGQEPEQCVSAPDRDPRPSILASLTLDQLRRHRPDLVLEAQHEVTPRIEELREQLDEMQARQDASQRRQLICELLQEHGLPLPAGRGVENQRLVSEQFVETLMNAVDEPMVRRLVEERAELVRSASRWNVERRGAERRPRSKDQITAALGASDTHIRGAKEFAAAVRGS
jgi:metal-responsive CopG/Arc/MetJ family transcriptional regulator